MKRASFNSLKSRIIIAITGVLAVSLLITTFFFRNMAKHELSEAIEGNALNLLEATKNHVESEYNSILYHKTVMLSRRKIELKNNVTLVFSMIDRAYGLYESGLLNEYEAKQRAITAVQQARYDDGVGYFWINDIGRPFASMIMHPTIPDLDGKILDNPEFNCALGKNENLFKAFVDICLENKEGYVDYLWPKPVSKGLTEKQPKISFVKLFKPWNWIIGSGVYIDDIERDVQNRIDAVIKDLNKTIRKQRIGESGYFFIFDEASNMLVHPNLVGQNNLINPTTGNLLLEELKESAHSSNHYMEYNWDKPGFEGEYRFPKKAFVTYYEPLGWYIGSSVYEEDFEHIITKHVSVMLLFSISFFAIALIISLLVSRSITKPLNNLINSISTTDKDGLPIKTISSTRITEIEVLSATINNMIDSIRKSGKELIKAKERAEESNSLKSAFLANMSHEIRTPMNGILGFASLLKEPKLTGEEQQAYISIIEEGGERMLNIINDLVDIAMIESRQMKISVEETNINEQIEYLYSFFKPLAEKKGIKLSFEVTLPVTESIIISDKEKIYAILTNLLKNAVKFSDKGSIVFGYHKKGEYLEFFVKDTGIGIAKDRQQAIFDRFVQADIKDVNVYEGSGLGLSISKAYVEMLDGKIWVESETGKGSQFYFTIPYKYKKEEIVTPKTFIHETILTHKIKELNILVVEDDETIDLPYITIIIKNLGKNITYAKTGTEAVELCKKNPDIDLVLMDIKIPLMNGYEATRKIREFNKDIIIIAQTAYVLSGDREKIMEAGCNDYISKPINKDELFEIVGKYFTL